MVLEDEVLKACDFLVSLESHVEVAPHFVNGKRAHERVCYHKLMGDDEKLAARNLCRKDFGEEFCFTCAGSAIIVLSKGN